MGANIKTLRTRIRSVDSTLHLTKAMGLVASSKIRKAGENMSKAKEYKSALYDMVEVLVSSPECAKSPYLAQREGERTRIIVIAGDRGLAGGYNANIFALLREYPGAEIIPIGKRACQRYNSDIVSSEGFTSTEARELADRLCAEFKAGEFDRLAIVSTEYVSIMTQTAKLEWILPLKKEGGKKNTGVLFEPDENSVLEAAVPEYIAGVIMASVRESFLSEVAARRMAMDAAGKNAQTMIDDLMLEYNSARQSAITQEITEIVAGSGE